MTDRLMEIFNFTAGDLNYNRSGQLSPQQQVRVAGSRRRLKRGFLVFGLILLALAAGWIAIFSQQKELSAAIVAMAVGAIIFGLPGLGALYLGVRPAPKIIVEKLQGPARVARVEHTSSSSGGARHYVKTELHLADRIFIVPDSAFSELQDGANYALYTWKGTNDIFSLEQL
jgi:hypothetical protein